MAWKNGPLPPKTYGWGGVVPINTDMGIGFYFADFCGDHVKIFPGKKVLKAEEVRLFDNSLELPPNGGKRIE